jgi:hypothetical protein
LGAISIAKATKCSPASTCGSRGRGEQLDGEQRLVALEELLERVEQQALAETAWTAQGLFTIS